MITEQQNSGSQTRDDSFGGFRRERLSILSHSDTNEPKAPVRVSNTMNGIKAGPTPCHSCAGRGDRGGFLRSSCSRLLASACETKPISRGQAAMVEGRQTRLCRRDWAEACQTKPIARSDRSGRGQARAPTEPPLGPVVQTKPICAHGQRWTRAGEGVSGGIARAKCAKQTQIALAPAGKGTS